jgi:hypothetical protein
MLIESPRWTGDSERLPDTQYLLTDTVPLESPRWRGLDFPFNDFTIDLDVEPESNVRVSPKYTGNLALDLDCRTHVVDGRPGMMRERVRSWRTQEKWQGDNDPSCHIVSRSW